MVKPAALALAHHFAVCANVVHNLKPVPNLLPRHPHK